jgi:hypothetical protein
MDEKLTQFVDHAREKGMDLATIRHLLVAVGWKDKDVAAAFCARDLEMTIPEPTWVALARSPSPRRPGAPRKARDAFLHLLTYGSLYVWSTSLILLLFTYLNFAFPDPAWRTSYTQLQALLSIIRGQLAVVIISFPIFLFVWNRLLRDVRQSPEAAKGVLRRWLGYLSLFVGAVTLAGNSMTLIYYLLEGQLTIRFVLKVAVLFLTAGGLVGYLAYTLRTEMQTEAKQ